MRLASCAALVLAAACLAGCSQKVEGVLDPAAVQPPPSERSAGTAQAQATSPAEVPQARQRRGLSVPAR